MWNVLEKVLLIQIRETLCLRLIALESKGGYTPYNLDIVVQTQNLSAGIQST